jgi:two-component system sensor histidine kinase UhpB
VSKNVIHVLLIEDNPGDARLIQERLREVDPAGFRMVIEQNLKAGLHTLEETPFDILLLDLSLPDSFGVVTLQKVRAAAPTIPIVVLTGSDDKTLGIQAMQLGAQDYLVKDDTDGKLLTRTIRYAIERHVIESQLRQSQKEYRSLIEDVFNTSSIGVLILDRDFKIVWLNDAIVKYYGFPREELLGHDKRLLLDEKIKCIFENGDDFAIRLLTHYRDSVYDQRLECHILPDETREERWLEHWSQPIRSGIYAGGRIEHHADITQRKQIEAAEREKAQELATAEERQRLARELHDSVTQTLFTSTVMSESSLRQWDNNPSRAHDLLYQSHQLGTYALAEMRLLLLELRPASLMQQNLSVLIGLLCQSLRSRTGIEVTTDLEEAAIPPADVKVALYRIVQEALNNITKHAHATHIQISLKNGADQINLNIRDNGKGFTRTQIPSTGLGLGIMEERATTIDAFLSIESAPGQGTCIHIIWPQPE